MRFYLLYLRLYEKYTFSMSAILDCELLPSSAKSQMGPDRFEISISKLTYKSMSCFYHSFEQSYNLCAMTNRFPAKSLQIVNLAAILDLKIFTNVINECLDYRYFIGYFQNASVSTLFKIIRKIHIFNVGHFGLRIQGGS